MALSVVSQPKKIEFVGLGQSCKLVLNSTSYLSYSDYRVLVIVDMYPSAGGSKTKNFIVQPDSGGKSVFDLAPVLRSVVSFQEPGYALLDAMKKPAGTQYNKAKYDITYVEYYNGAVVPASLVSLAYDNIVLNGGLSTNDNASYNFYDDIIDGTATYLNWQPAIRYMHAEDRNLITVISATTTSSLKVKLKLYFSDGSSQLQDAFTIDSSASEGDLAYFDVGPACVINFFGSLVTDEELIAYDYVLLNGSTEQTDWKTIHIDRAPRLNVRKYMFKNSFGVPEYISFTGSASKSIQLNKETAERVFFPKSSGLDYLIEEHGTINYYGEHVNQLKVSCGVKSKAEIEWLQEFLISSQVWEVVESGTSAIETYPVNVVTKTAQIWKDQENQIHFTAIIEGGRKEHFYSNAGN